MIGENSDFVFRNDVNVVQQIREAIGLDRKEFAELMGVDYDTVWGWETGRRQPKFTVQQVKVIWHYAKRLNIDLSDIPDNLIN
jgi:transcriptional regulator with XRE-family HTH domain